MKVTRTLELFVFSKWYFVFIFFNQVCYELNYIQLKYHLNYKTVFIGEDSEGNWDMSCYHIHENGHNLWCHVKRLPYSQCSRNLFHSITWASQFRVGLATFVQGLIFFCSELSLKKQKNLPFRSRNMFKICQKHWISPSSVHYCVEISIFTEME